MTGSELDFIARETPLPFVGDRDSPFGHVVTATLEEIRYAEFLRTRLRQTLLTRGAGAATAWPAGAD